MLLLRHSEMDLLGYGALSNACKLYDGFRCGTAAQSGWTFESYHPHGPWGHDPVSSYSWLALAGEG